MSLQDNIQKVCTVFVCYELKGNIKILLTQHGYRPWKEGRMLLRDEGPDLTNVKYAVLVFEPHKAYNGQLYGLITHLGSIVHP